VSAPLAHPAAALAALRGEVRAASWFAALGEPLTGGELEEAQGYAGALGLGDLDILPARDWADAERHLKSPDWSTAWWDGEDALRRACLAEAEERHTERALWTALTDLTTEAGDLVHGRAATAAARAGGVSAATIHVAAGAAAHAVYQVALARLAGAAALPFETKLRLFAAGRWPLGVVGKTLALF